MVSRVIPVDAFDLVVFGGTGDLARRKILPALLRRYCVGQIPPNASIIGAARSGMERAEYQEFVRIALQEFVPEKTGTAELEGFLERVDYVQIDARGTEGWADLVARFPQDRIRAFYFSVSPVKFGDLAERIRSNG